MSELKYSLLCVSPIYNKGNEVKLPQKSALSLDIYQEDDPDSMKVEKHVVADLETSHVDDNMP